MKVRTIKDVDDETWKLLKETAKKKKLKMGTLLKEITTAYKRKPSESWNKILNSKPIFTEREAAYMIRMVEQLRKESGHRDVTNS